MPGPEHAFGVSIRLPFEASTSQFIAGDPKLVNFRYFFTRKLAFIKESDGFVLLPGGFGTLDEAFELLTLVQTGKAQPGPIVLLDVPGGTYWSRWESFVRAELMDRGYISEHDLCLVTVTDDVDVAVDEVTSASSRTTTPSGSSTAAGAPRAPRARRQDAGSAQLGVRRHRRAAGRSSASTRRQPRSPTTITSSSSGSRCGSTAMAGPDYAS